MNTTSELKKIIALMKKNRVTKVKTPTVEIEIDINSYILEEQKKVTETVSQTTPAQDKKETPTKDQSLPDGVRPEDLVGPFPSY